MLNQGELLAFTLDQEGSACEFKVCDVGAEEMAFQLRAFAELPRGPKFRSEYPLGLLTTDCNSSFWGSHVCKHVAESYTDTHTYSRF